MRLTIAMTSRRPRGYSVPCRRSGPGSRRPTPSLVSNAVLTERGAQLLIPAKILVVYKLVRFSGDYIALFEEGARPSGRRNVHAQIATTPRVATSTYNSVLSPPSIFNTSGLNGRNQANTVAISRL